MRDSINKVIVLSVRKGNHLVLGTSEPVRAWPEHKPCRHHTLNALSTSHFIFCRCNLNNVRKAVLLNHSVLQERTNALANVATLSPPVKWLAGFHKLQHFFYRGLRTKTVPYNVRQDIKRVTVVSGWNHTRIISRLTLAYGMVTRTVNTTAVWQLVILRKPISLEEPTL